MDSSLKQRLVGAVVLIALAVIFLPMMVKGPAPDSGVSDVPLNVPAEPKAQGDMQSIDLPLTAPGAAPAGGATGMPTAAPADAAPAPTTAFPTDAAGDYAVSFGSYASVADADKVIAALKAAELTAYREAVQLNGREAQRVRIGPFADRAVAESARLRAAQVNDAVGAKVIALAAATPAPATTATTTDAAPPTAPAKVEALPPPPKPVATAPAKPAPETKPAAAPAKPVAAKPATVAPPAPKVESRPADTSKTGFVVQVGAFADAAAAAALRDKLRGAGFNAFTDTVNTDGGKRTRVRVGPAMDRAEADVLKAQVKAKAGIDGIVRPHP